MEDQTQNTAPKQPETNEEPRTEAKPAESAATSSGNKRGLIIGIAIAIVVIVIACIIVFMTTSGGSQSAVSQGQLENKTPEEIQAELDREVEEGMLSISINSYLEMEDGSSDAELRIENSPANNYKMQVDIVLQDTNELIYTSDILEPNSHIQSAKLLVDLPKGSYSCLAKFYALDLETDEGVGEARAQIFIDVLN